MSNRHVATLRQDSPFTNNFKGTPGDAKIIPQTLTFFPVPIRNGYVATIQRIAQEVYFDQLEISTATADVVMVSTLLLNGSPIDTPKTNNATISNALTGRFVNVFQPPNLDLIFPNDVLSLSVELSGVVHLTDSSTISYTAHTRLTVTGYLGAQTNDQ